MGEKTLFGVQKTRRVQDSGLEAGRFWKVWKTGHEGFGWMALRRREQKREWVVC